MIANIWKMEFSNRGEGLQKSLEEWQMAFHEEHEANVIFIGSDLLLTNDIITGRFQRDEKIIEWLEMQQLYTAKRAIVNLNNT